MGVPFECTAGSHMGPALSALFAYGVAGVPLLLAVAFAVWRFFYHSRIADRYHKLASSRPHNAPVRALRGKVVLDQGEPFAARVEIEQRGKTWKHKRNVYHSWEETERRVNVRPFRVRADDGTLVQVEARADTLLGMPFRRATGDRDERAIIAELHNGQEVIVMGRVFERAGGAGSSVYRGDSGPRTIVRTPSAGRLVVSTGPIDAAFRSRRMLHLKWLGISLAAVVLVHGVLLGGYHLRELFGEHAVATVTGKHTVRGSKSTSYYVATQTASSKPLGDESASLDCYNLVRPGDQVDVVLVGGESTFMQLGAHPTANVIFILVSCGTVLGVLINYRRALRTKGPWYLRRKVDMRGDGPANVDELPEA